MVAIPFDSQRESQREFELPDYENKEDCTGLLAYSYCGLTDQFQSHLSEAATGERLQNFNSRVQRVSYTAPVNS